MSCVCLNRGLRGAKGACNVSLIHDMRGLQETSVTQIYQYNLCKIKLNNVKRNKDFLCIFSHNPFSNRIIYEWKLGEDTNKYKK